MSFANRVPFYGLVVACLDHPHVQDILPRIEKRVATYGLSAQADYRARNPEVKGLTTTFEVIRRGDSLGQFEVRMPGLHNVLNALATIAVADELARRPRQDARVRSPASPECSAASPSWASTRASPSSMITGTIRPKLRQHLKLRSAPTGAVCWWPFSPIATAARSICFDELTRAFNRADVLFLTDVYAAGEEPIEGADSAHLAQAIRAHGHRDVTLVPQVGDLVQALAQRAQPGDVIITMGAGNITRIGRDLLAHLTPERSQRVAPDAKLENSEAQEPPACPRPSRPPRTRRWRGAAAPPGRVSSSVGARLRRPGLIVLRLSERAWPWQACGRSGACCSTTSPRRPRLPSRPSRSQGLTRVERAELLEAAGIDVGKNVFAPESRGRARASSEASLVFRSHRSRAILPGRFDIKVREREPVALLLVESCGPRTARATIPVR